MKRTFLLFSFLALFLPHLAAAHPGWGLVVDPHGTVYFTDLERVWKIDAEGRVSVFVEDVHTHALYLDEAGVLYGEHHGYEPATDTFHDRYWKATPEGRVTDITLEEAARFFDRWDEQGNQFRLFNDKEKAVVTRTTPEGDSVLIAGGPFGHVDGCGAQARFRLFGTSAWGPDQSIYVTNGGLLRRVTRHGTVTTLIGPEQGFPHSVQDNGRPRYSALLGLAVAADGTVYFADIDQRKVFKRAPDGAIATVLDGGMLWTPSGVTLAGDDLYVLEYRRDFASPTNRIGKTGPRVRKIAPDGFVTVVGVADG